MEHVSVGELKADFSHILSEVQDKGKSYIIEYGKKHKKVAKLVPYEEEKLKPRQLGILRHLNVTVPDDFGAEDEQINAMFYEGDIFPDRS